MWVENDALAHIEPELLLVLKVFQGSTEAVHNPCKPQNGHLGEKVTSVLLQKSEVAF